MIKRLLPKPVKSGLIVIKQKTYDQYKKKQLFAQMQKKHASMLQDLKGKKKVKVVFLAIHKSVWKVDPVFKKMLADPLFEPEILVCPYTVYGEERMQQDMVLAYDYFSEKGYPVKKAKMDNGEWVKLKDLQPDIVFFTNPHKLTREEYYENAYLNYLSCYVPYHHEVGSYADNIGQYNQLFHNALWKIFSSHQASYDLFKKTSPARAENVELTGYPSMEDLLLKSQEGNYQDVWKNKSSKLKVIWAPHHTIDDPALPYSNFLEYAKQFQELALRYRQEVAWAFKPHPILKSKLYSHPEWGKKKTDEFYGFWSENTFSQLEEGEYLDLFISSDIMIHDSGSFLAEYLYLNKPVMYLLSEENKGNYYTAFGIKALAACEIGRSFDDVIKFLQGKLLDKSIVKPEHYHFLKDEVEPYFKDVEPSDKILGTLKDMIA